MCNSERFCECLKWPWKKLKKGLKRIFCCSCCKASVYSNDDEECSEGGDGIDLDETGNYTGSNVSRPPRQHEMPKPNNPSGGNSSNSQNISIPIKN